VVSFTHLTEDCLGPKADLEAVEKRKILSLSEIEPQFLGIPACSPSLYRHLRNNNNNNNNKKKKK
jgi:hypothetical protein